MSRSEDARPLGGDETFESSGGAELLDPEGLGAEAYPGGADESVGSTASSAQDDDGPGSGERSDASRGIKVQVDIKESKDSRIEASGTRIDTQYQQIFAGGEGADLAWRRDLVRDDFDVLVKDQLDQIDSSYVVSDDDRDAVVRCAERHRIAIVVGERGLGKGVLCQVAAARLAEGDTSVRQVLLAGSLDRSLRIRPEALFEERSDLSRSILILEDAFERSNEDLCRLMQRLSSPRLEGLAMRLTTAQTYMLLTSDPEGFPGQLDGLQGMGVLARLEPPTVEVLVQTLHRRARQRSRDAVPEDSDRDETVKGILKSHGEWLASRLRTLPRVVTFVDSLLAPVIRNELTIEEAVDRLDDLEYWLLTELPEDQPVWCFVLALVLASTDPHSPWVPWSRLYRLWRQVEARVETELGRDEDSGLRPLSRLIVSQMFLDHAKAEIRRRPYPMGEAVRFKDPTLGKRLWRVLLGGGRSILATLYPRLEELAHSPEPATSVLAARALGRMDELDPRGGTLARLDAFLSVEKDDERLRRALVAGEMLVGASTSEDRAYFSGSLDRLRAVTGGGSAESAEGAVMALAPLGAVHPDLALDLLWSVARARATKAAEAALPLRLTVDRQIEELAKSHRHSSEKDTVRLQPLAIETAALRALGNRPSRILEAVQFALIGLSFGGEAIRVLESMARWMRTGEGNLAPWLAFLTLRSRGVLQVLEDFPLRPPMSAEEPDSAARERHACSRILLAADDEEEILHVTELLEVAYEETGAFPRILRSWLRRNLLGVLEGWMRQAARSDLIRARTVALLSQLLDGGCEDLRRDVFQLTRRRAEGNSNELQEVALEILRAGAPGATRGVATQALEAGI